MSENFVVDSGASMHMMNKQESSSDDIENFRKSKNATVVLTAHKEMHTCKETLVFVFYKNQFVIAQLLEEAPTILSLRKLCENHRCSCEWVSGRNYD